MPSGSCGPPREEMQCEVGWGAQVLGEPRGAEGMVLQRGWRNGRSPYRDPLAGEGDRPHCPLIARGRDTGMGSPAMVIRVQGSVLGPSAKACPSFSWAFPAQGMVCVTEGSSHLAGG